MVSTVNEHETRTKERSQNRRTALQAASVILQGRAVGDVDHLLRMSDRLFDWLER